MVRVPHPLLAPQLPQHAPKPVPFKEDMQHKQLSRTSPSPTARKKTQPRRTPAPANSTRAESGHILAHRHADQTNFRIAPIKIYYKTQQINTFAFLDEGSSVTLIEETIFQQLGVTGVTQPLCLKWTDNTTRVEETSKTATLRVFNTQNGAKFKLKDVRSVRSLNLPMQSANMEELAMKFPYLKGLPIASYANVRPTIVVGADIWNLAVPLRIREGAWRQPIAYKTRLGWTLQIPPSKRTNTLTSMSANADTALHEAIKQTFAVETPRRAHLF